MPRPGSRAPIRGSERSTAVAVTLALLLAALELASPAAAQQITLWQVGAGALPSAGYWLPPVFDLETFDDIPDGDAAGEALLAALEGQRARLFYWDADLQAWVIAYPGSHGESHEAGGDDELVVELLASQCLEGEVIVGDGSGGLDCGEAGGGGGGIGGSTGSADNAVLAADGVGGSTVQPRRITIDDTGAIATTAQPTDFATPVMWLKADALALSDGDPVATWTDSSGSANHVTQATAGKRPSFQTNEINSLPVVRFDGGDCLADASVSISTFSIFAVFRATASGLLYEHSADVNSAPGGGYLNLSKQDTINAKRTQLSARNVIAWNQGGSQIDWGAQDLWTLALHSFGGSHALHRLWVNGAYPTQNAGSSTQDPGTGAATTELNLGCRDESSVFITGDIAEFIVYSPRLSSARERAVILYLQGKYDL